MNRGVSGLVAGVALACLASGAWAETLKLGVIAPLTGGGAPWGVAAAEGAKILAAEENAKGGLDVGGTKYQLEIIAYDDQYKAADSISAYNRLVNQDGVKLMLIHTSPAAVALKQTVEDDEVVAITSAASRNAVDPDATYFFRIQSPTDDFIPAEIAWLGGHLKERRVTLVNPNDETGWSFVDMATKSYEANGFEIAGSELYERSQKDFVPLFTKIIQENPEMIDLGGVPPATAGMMVRQARDLGYSGKFIKTTGPSPREIIDAAGADATEGMIMQLFADHQNPAYDALAQQYRDSVGGEPNEMILPIYDGFRVLLAAVQKAGTVDDTAAIAAAMHEVLPMTATLGDELTAGGEAAIGGKQQVVTTSYIAEVRDGAPVTIGKVK